jgi:ribosomal protein L32
MDRNFRAAQRRYDNDSEPTHDYRVTPKMIRCKQCGKWKQLGDDPNVCDDCANEDLDNE